jgi:AraC-like DNA-binding protein
MADPNGQNPVRSSSLFFTTAILPARDRLSVWREVFGQTMVRLDIEPTKGIPFCAEGALCALPGAALASVTASPVRVSRTPRLIAEDMVDMVFLVTADAPLHIVQRGRGQILQVGDAIFVRGSECSTIHCGNTTRFTNISVPIDDLMPLLASHDDLSMTVVNRQNDGLDLLMNYVSLLQARKKPLPDEFGRIAAAHIRDLMAATIGADPDCNPQVGERGGVRAARLRAIKADIGRHLCEPGLSIATIAMRHGISPRYVRKLFQDEQTTFSDFVLLLRLERSRQLLRSPQHTASTVASIAHACGFGDLSYFNRTFRRRYSITPSDLRNGIRVSGRILGVSSAG